MMPHAYTHSERDKADIHRAAQREQELAPGQVRSQEEGR